MPHVFLLRYSIAPLRRQTLETFRVADPWNGGAPTDFHLELCEWVPEHLRDRGVEVERVRRWAGDGEGYGLRAATGEALHMLPDALLDEVRNGHLPAPELPRILHRLQPDLTEDDYPPFRRRHLAVWVGVSLAVGVLGTLGRQALAASVGPDSPLSVWAQVLGLIGLLVAFGTALALPREWGRLRRRKEIVERAQALRAGSH
jgi:hypothetical protein